MEIRSLPEHLQFIATGLIAHVHEGFSIQSDVVQLTEWFEDEGWDEIVGSWSDERIVLDLGMFADLSFSDSELCGYEDIEGAITDDLRLGFARKRIHDEFESGDGYSCPSVHTVQLKNDQGQDAFLGWLVRIHGQLGHVPNYWGIFSDREKFYSELRKSGFLFYDEKDTLSDRQILLLWKLDIS